jgi:hypothetical protein
MSVEHGNGKVCVICREDCSHRPRTKDASGRYYCTPCYAQAIARRPGASPSSRRDGPALPPIDAGPLMELAPAVNTTDRRTCVACGHAIATDAVLCTACGYNTQTGERLQVDLCRADPMGSSAGGLLAAPLDLLFRPGRFFRGVGASPPRPLVLAAMWICGMTTVLDRVQNRVAIAEFLGGHDQLFSDAWLHVWGAALLGGVAAGALIWAIQGWWYRIRIGWSGGTAIGASSARSVFALTTLVACVPALAWFASLATSHATPREAFTSELGWSDLVAPLFGFWSLWTSYAAVRTVFQTRPVRTAVWFILAPLVFQVLLIVGIVVAMGTAAAFVMDRDAVSAAPGGDRPDAAARAFAPLDDEAGDADATGQPGPRSSSIATVDGRQVTAGDMTPDTAQHKTHTNETLTFNYPGNWTIDAEHADYDPHADLYVDANVGGGSVHIIVSTWAKSVEHELNRALDEAGAGMNRASAPEPFETWGQLRGKGLQLTGEVKGIPMRLCLFVAKCPNGIYVEVHEFIELAQESRLAAGFTLVRESFQQPRKAEAPNRRTR